MKEQLDKIAWLESTFLDTKRMQGYLQDCFSTLWVFPTPHPPVCELFNTQSMQGLSSGGQGEIAMYHYAGRHLGECQFSTSQTFLKVCCSSRLDP